MNTNSISSVELQRAVATLRNGELVAFPTETVYGLGADASNADAVRKIFELKGRPSNHPVIVHIADAAALPNWARDIPSTALQLARAFWPGPFTLVLKRAAKVSDAVTGGQDTVAIRVPANPVAQQILREFGGGIAAPSANRFGHVSPTSAAHVRDEFGDAVLILDGGDCEVGLESTIVSCVDAVPQLLRPGGISLSQLRAVVPEVSDIVASDAPRAPGMLEKHYSPSTPIRMVNADELATVVGDYVKSGDRIAVLARRPAADNCSSLVWINGGADANAYGHSLYANLRALDKVQAKLMVVEQVPSDERWQAVRDRLQRAAAS